MKHYTDFFYQNRRETEKQRTRILGLLKDEKLSVSQIASKLNLDKPLVLWNLLGMLRWGQVDIHESEQELIFASKEE